MNFSIKKPGVLHAALMCDLDRKENLLIRRDEEKLSDLVEHRGFAPMGMHSEL